MPRYVAFLRTINVGGHVVRMDRLRRLFEDLEFSGVETFIASGNVVFDSAATDVRALERRIETALEKALGYAVATFVRSAKEVAAIARHQPFGAEPPGAGPYTTYVIFLAAPLSAAARTRVLSLAADGSELAVKGREIYWRQRGPMLEAPFTGPQLGRAAGAATMRNRNTVVRLAAKYPPD
jgi:uncharacterized protein (DUF1697 family)